MLTGLLEAFKIPELRKRILFTVWAIFVFRLGAWIPVPGVDPQAVQNVFQELGQLGAFLSAFTGGALERFSIFALGVIPYINASIILSLLIPVIPRLKEIQERGEEGRRVINKITRYGTVGLAILQSIGTSYVLHTQGLTQPNQALWSFMLISVVTLTTGTMFLMWLGERITENGIGRGISMLIMAGILAEYPRFLGQIWFEVTNNIDPVRALWIPILIAMFLVVTAGVVMVQLGARRVDIQYAKRIVRGRVYGGHNTFLPLQVNQGGVIPIIFASALLAIPTTFFQMGQRAEWWPIPSETNPEWLNGLIGFLNWMADDLIRGAGIYMLISSLLIFFFTYFYSAIVFNPRDLAENLRKWGGFIPGIRPGKPTTDFIESVQARLLFIGATFLVAMALLPMLITNMSGFTALFLGGTSLLIVVGVGVDTIKQIEAHMVERQYESLIEKGAALGRRF
ncbi:preprotein translocase subunit SecY [Candidatus Acetothermia bacterium]|jgi:preprotein translocase subunit SecY|nr:preprotein translocase subunit SecY [Candidatus Acetothermia bacterium]MCI2431154.1 preprotein translocase subunit SecY [Candidatus Acetothermia bacterium]MCI2436044.1 preprotein translocase subunit SecY [Candidatus Acetothermia bacterium]